MPVLTFSNEYERHQHPEAGLIPPYLWPRYFKESGSSNRSLDLELLQLMKEKDSGKAIDLARNSAYENKMALWISLTVSHPDIIGVSLESLARDTFHLPEDDVFVASVCMRSASLTSAFIRDDYADYVYIAAFRFACEMGDQVIADLLLEQCPEKKNVMIEGDNFIGFSSACSSNLAIAVWLLAQCPADKKNAMIEANKFAAFAAACANGQQAIAEWLLVQLPERETP